MLREGGDAQVGITTSRSFHSMSLTRSFSSFSAREICDVPSRTRMSTAVPFAAACLAVRLLQAAGGSLESAATLFFEGAHVLAVTNVTSV